jgi:trigger factor
VQFANIPGFRKGRAPVNLVSSRFAKEIWEETRERLISGSFREAIKQAQLNPLAILDVKTDAVPSKPMVYRLVLDVPPEFKLPKYKHIPVTTRKVEVSNDDLQKALDSLMERMTKIKNVTDRPTRKGDWVQVDYTRQDSEAPRGKPRGIFAEPCEAKDAIHPCGKPQGILAKKGKNQPTGAGGKQPDKFASGRNAWMAVGEKDLLLPGFADALEGIPIRGRKEVVLQLPADFNVPELAGRQVVYDVQVKAIRERERPVLNDAFFKSTGVQSEAELRDKMNSSLLAEAFQQEKNRQVNEIIEYLLKNTVMELPESIVQEESRNMFATLARERLMRGLTREQLASQRDEIHALAAKTAGEKVKMSYILHKIGEEEKIAVEEKEVEKEIQNIAGNYGLAPAEMKKELEKKKEMDAIRHEIRMRKILDFLLASALAEEKGIMSRLFSKKEEVSSQEPE